MTILEIGDLVKSFVVGFILGGAFVFFNLPIPAPQTLSGVVGVFGVFVGFAVLKRIS